MVRMYKSQARLLLGLLTAIKLVREGPEHTSAEYDARMGAVVMDHANSTDTPVASVLRNTALQHITEDLDLDNFIQDLTEQVMSTETSNGDQPLLDSIVDLLQLPWTGNRIGAETLDTMRKAILRPSEVNNFAKVSREAFVCSACSHKFTSRELGCLVRGANNNLLMQCMNCASPAYAACPHCRESAVLSGTVVSILRSSKMTQCSCVKKVMKDGVQASSTFRQAVGPQQPSSATPTALDVETDSMTLLQQAIRSNEPRSTSRITRREMELRDVDTPPPGFRSRAWSTGGALPDPFATADLTNIPEDIG